MQTFDQPTRYDHRLTAAQPCAVHCYTNRAPGSAMLPDMHYALHCGILLRGQLQVHYPDHTVEVAPGQLWLTSCWEPHLGRTALYPTEILLCTFLLDALGNIDPFEGGNWLAPFLLPPSQRPQAIAAAVRHKFTSIAGELRDSLAEPVSNSRLLFHWLKIHELLLTLQQAGTTPAGATQPTTARDTGLRIMPALQLTRPPQSTPVSLNDAAQACNLGRSRFSELFQQTMGISFGKFALRARVFGAAAELRSSSQPLKRIALKWGFTDTSHFNRIFQQFMHCTPGVYRAGTTTSEACS